MRARADGFEDMVNLHYIRLKKGRITLKPDRELLMLMTLCKLRSEARSGREACHRKHMTSRSAASAGLYEYYKNAEKFLDCAITRQITKPRVDDLEACYIEAMEELMERTDVGSTHPNTMESSTSGSDTGDDPKRDSSILAGTG